MVVILNNYKYKYYATVAVQPTFYDQHDAAVAA